MGITKEEFGVSPKGEKIYEITLENRNGMKAKLINYGAILRSLYVPDKNNHFDDVVLGYDSLEGYFTNPGGYGSTIGRHANRIENSEIIINGIKYELDKNEGENNLHSGFNGYQKRVWGFIETDSEEPSVDFTLLSPDGDQGFPGNLEIQVSYRLTNDNEIVITYHGVSDEDTIINMTNHSYFNLSGHDSGTICNHKLWIKSNEFTPVGEKGSIPTGEIRSVKGTPMDFTVLKRIGEDIDSDYEQILRGQGYDHNYVLDIKGDKVEKIALLEDEKSGRKMEVFTDLPGVQLYTGNFIAGTEVGKEGTVYKKTDGICLETQYYPDAIHHENFKSPVVKKGEIYHTTTIFKFTS